MYTALVHRKSTQPSKLFFLCNSCSLPSNHSPPCKMLFSKATVILWVLSLVTVILHSFQDQIHTSPLTHLQFLCICHLIACILCLPRRWHILTANLKGPLYATQSEQCVQQVPSHGTPHPLLSEALLQSSTILTVINGELRVRTASSAPFSRAQHRTWSTGSAQSIFPEWMPIVSQTLACMYFLFTGYLQSAVTVSTPPRKPGWGIFSSAEPSWSWLPRHCWPCLSLPPLDTPNTSTSNSAGIMSSCLSPLLDCRLLAGRNLFHLSPYSESLLHNRWWVTKLSFLPPSNPCFIPLLECSQTKFRWCLSKA